MFQPQDAAGQPTDLGGAVTGRSNSLIGLGLGLLSPSNPLRGQSSWGQALEGFQGGAQIDARTAAAAAQLKQHRADQARAQANADRAFARSGETDFQKIQADIQKYGEPARQFYANKAGDTSSIVKITNPNTGEDESVLYNPRAPAGQQFRPVPTDIFNPPAAPAVPAAPAAPAAPEGAPDSFASRFDAVATPASASASAAVPAAPTAPRGPADLPPRVGPKAFENEEKLRKEFNAATKPHQEVRQSYNRLLAAKDTAAGDIALIFGYMRMLDPGSVVREGEFATAQNAAGIPDMVRNMYNRALSGERLNPNQRDQFKDQAGAIYQKYDQEYSARAEQFRGIAKQNRIDPSRVIPDLGPAPKAAEKAAGDPLAEARDAIKRGAPRAAVIERLAKGGIRFNPKDLD